MLEMILTQRGFGEEQTSTHLQHNGLNISLWLQHNDGAVPNTVEEHDRFSRILIHRTFSCCPTVCDS